MLFRVVVTAMVYRNRATLAALHPAPAEAGAPAPAAPPSQALAIA
jgi:hypothetical protein